MSLSDNLRAFWKLADTSDSGPNGFTLTNNNTVTFVAGKIGDAARFAAASSQYLSRADHASLSFGNVDFSISVWVKLASTGITRPIVNKASAEWRLGITSANKIIFQFPGGGALTHSLALSASTWYHVVAWYDAAADLMWIAINDGTPESASDSVGPVDSTNDLRVGRLGTAYWDGDLDALGIWGRVLTAGERTQLYNSGNGLEYPFTVGSFLIHPGMAGLTKPRMLGGMHG